MNNKMERMDKNKPLWRKITPGTLYPFPAQRDRMVKPKEVIRATQEELGKFVDEFELLEDGKGKNKVSKEPGSNQDNLSTVDKEVYEIKSTRGGKFNVFSESGKKMNDKALTANEAEELKNSLEEETPEE